MHNILVDFEGKYMIYTPYGTKEEWKDSKISLLSDGRIIINDFNKEFSIRCKNVEPVDERIPSSITGLVTLFETYSVKHRDKKYFLLVTGEKKYIKRLTRFICYFNLIGSPCYILYPYMIGGAIQKNVKWRKTIFEIKLKRLPGRFEERIVFKYDNSTLIISLDKVINFKREKVSVQNREIEVLNVKFLGEKDVSYGILIYMFNLNLLEKIFKTYFDEHEIKREETVEEEFEDVELSDVEEQVLYALYSGINSLEVHSLLGMDINDIEKIYDKLIDKGLLKLIRLRKEVELTSKGKYIVEKIMKEKGTKI